MREGQLDRVLERRLLRWVDRFAAAEGSGGASDYERATREYRARLTVPTLTGPHAQLEVDRPRAARSDEACRAIERVRELLDSGRCE